MNRITIIGNLTRDPEQRTTAGGKRVTTFTVAVSRRGQAQEADFFRVSAWESLGDICQKYLAKGRKVAVCGSVSMNVYDGNDGKTRANLEVYASEVEFLSRSGENEPKTEPQKVETPEELPWKDDLPY